MHPCTMEVCSAQSEPSKSVFNISNESNVVVNAFIHILQCLLVFENALITQR